MPAGIFRFAHSVRAAGHLEGKADELEAAAGPGPIRVTTPVAEATARNEGQQRAQSWALHLGPAPTSGTSACGLALIDQPQAALETPASTRR